MSTDYRANVYYFAYGEGWAVVASLDIVTGETPHAAAERVAALLSSDIFHPCWERVPGLVLLGKAKEKGHLRPMTYAQVTLALEGAHGDVVEVIERTNGERIYLFELRAGGIFVPITRLPDGNPEA